MLLLFVVGPFSFWSVSAQDLTRDQALKIGSDNDGAGNGKFWFEHGDSSPPFTHAGHINISRGSGVFLTLNDGATSGLGVDAPHEDGSETRLDFFTSSNGKGWVAAHVLKPEIEETAPEGPRDERSPVHRALSPAAELAIEEGDLDFLASLLKRGLQINEALDFEDGDTLLHAATSWQKVDIVKFLLQNGADRTIRDRYGDRPIDAAIGREHEELCVILSMPEDKDTVVDEIPSGLIAELLPHQTNDEIIFVSWNDRDPSAELLAEIQKTAPEARPASQMKTLSRRPLGANSSYQDKESKEFGTLIEVGLKNEAEVWIASVRTSTGPIMAGGGWRGKARKGYGYWFTYDVEFWDE